MHDQTLDIRLFGGLQVTCDGQPMARLGSARQQALLAWLLLHCDTPQTRKHIAFVFWPDSSEHQALTNLRRGLHHLRQHMTAADACLEITPQTICWRAGAQCTLDTAEFERLLAACRDSADVDSQRAGLAQAAALYRGELLAGVLDDWLAPFRQTFHHRAVEALESLFGLYEQRGDQDRAVACANRLLELEPVHERTCARLMQLHWSQGDRALSLRVYNTCVRALQEELGAQPGDEVQRVYRALREEQPPPTQPDMLPLIGRKSEWAALLALWDEAHQAGARAIVVTGEAGIGKGRLAEALFAQAEDEDAITARTRSYAAEGRLAFAPLGEWLRSPALQANLPRLDAPWLEEIARLLPELLQRTPDLPVPQPLSEGWQRHHLFEALARAFVARDAPMFDDLQWCDRDTLEWLHYLLRFAPQAPLLLLGTLRSEEQDDNPALGELLGHWQQQALLHRIERRVLFGADVGVFSLAWGSHGVWLQGDIEQARQQVAEAQAIAARLDHPFTTMQASAYRSIYWQLERDSDVAGTSAEATVAGCERHNIGYYREWGVIVGGWALAMRGDTAEGGARIRRGLDALRRQDAYLRRPYYLSLLVEVCLATNAYDEARGLLDAAMALAADNRDLWWLPELWRLRGIVSAIPHAESCFTRALSTAHDQGSRSLALRAATSLATWLRDDGRGSEAIPQLGPICESFPDYVDSHDLSAARALLNELD